MRPQTLILGGLVSSLILFVAGFILTNAVAYDLCNQGQYTCRELLNNIGDPLFYTMPALALVFLILLFIPQAFAAWKKFAVWFIPLAALLFILYPYPGSGDLFSPYPEQVYRWVSGLYVIVSIVIVAWSSMRRERSPRD